MVNGQEYGPFSGINSEPAFSAEGGHWACCVSTGEQKFAVLADGKMITLDRIAPGTQAYQPGTGQLTLLHNHFNEWHAAVTFEVKGDATCRGRRSKCHRLQSETISISPRCLPSGYGTSEVKQQIAIG